MSKSNGTRTGIESRTDSSGRKSHRGSVYDKRTKKRLRSEWTHSLSEAKAWRVDTQSALRHGKISSGDLCLEQATEGWLNDARRHIIRNRSGDPYKPSAIRGYEQAFRLRIIPGLGPATRVAKVRTPDVQKLVYMWQEDGYSPSRIHNTVTALRALYRHLISIGDADINPTRDLKLPAKRTADARIVNPAEAEELLEVLEMPERAIWGMAFYAGLRAGELQALLWENLDLEKGAIRVRSGWDPIEGEVAPKSKAGVRDIPICRPLRIILVEYKLQCERSTGLVFGRSVGVPFATNSVTVRANKGWDKLEGVGLHAARHCAASYMIASGVNIKAIQTFMGHASITTTLDLYGHLLPGYSFDEAVTLMDDFFGKAAEG